MPRITPDQREECVRRYLSGESAESLGMSYGLSGVAVRNLVRRRGHALRTQSESQRRRSLDRAFFRLIDGEPQAYWLGFLYADGCVTGNQITLRLAPVDRSHLERFRSDIGSDHAITPISRRDGECDAYQFSVRSSEMVSRLAALGVTEKKSLTATPPALPDELARHFWRGVFDGDGNLYLPRVGVARNYAVRLYGTKETCLKFGHWAESVCDVVPRVKPHRGIWMARAGGIIQCSKVAAALYEGATVFLDRKMIAARSFAGIRDERHPSNLLPCV